MPVEECSACVCYVANTGYLFQTLASAIGVANRRTHNYDVVIVDLSRDRGAESSVVERVSVAENIKYLWVDPAILDGAHIMNGRLVLPDILPDKYKKIIYIDGDTQAPQGVDELVAFEPRPGHICAVRDPMVFLRHVGLLEPKYVQEVGGFGEDYINSGVFAILRNDLADLARSALPLIRRDRELSHFQDQTAINTVMSGRVQFASLRWNFPGFILGYGLEQLVSPRLVHFMSNPRPWQGNFAPWGKAWHQPYILLLERYPELKPFNRGLTLTRRYGYYFKQLRKSRAERRIWDNSLMRAAVQVLEADVAV